ncbi:MAG: ATP-binding cassette domain-containing protein [Methanomicrobiales archaeon]|nr:ATP-binding cassette domain-containing protein [Methanomicrobiales archaeon]
MTRRSTAIDVQEITKRFDDIVAVDRVSFDVRCGEIFGFLGPNGAGKTTTVRMLTGIIRPDAGSIHVMGYDMARDPVSAKQQMGVVPETANAYLDLTARQNMLLAADLYDVPRARAEERIREILSELGLLDRQDHRVHGYSKGMHQRLILGMALLHEPPILFLDEPTSGLDVQSTHLIIAMLQRLNEEGTTIFLTTHNMDEANRLCHRVGIIRRGRIAAIDTPEQLKRTVDRIAMILVAFDRSVDTEALAALPGVAEVSRANDRYRVSVEDIDTAIGSVVSFAHAQGMRILSLDTPAPSLDEVFLTITGGDE